jgi:hypothetical protein
VLEATVGTGLGTNAPGGRLDKGRGVALDLVDDLAGAGARGRRGGVVRVHGHVGLAEGHGVEGTHGDGVVKHAAAFLLGRKERLWWKRKGAAGWEQ